MGDLWRFLGSEGCAVCDGMDGFYEAEPVPPHPKCQCQIIAPGTEYEAEEIPRPWTSESVSSVRGEGGSTNRSVVIVECSDGSHPVELYDMFIRDDDPRSLEEIAEDMEGEMEDVAERLIEDECPADEDGAGDVIT
jgi:hypothetical protein